MFKRIWNGWLDGWQKAIDFSFSNRSWWHFAFTLPTFMVFGAMLGFGVWTVIVRPEYVPVAQVLGLLVGGLNLYIIVLLPILAKFSSWWNRSGPGGRRPMHTLWKRFKRSRIANWWLKGMAMLMICGTDHGYVAILVLGLLIVAFIVALSKISETTVPILVYSTLSLIATAPFLSYASSRLWRRISKTPHLYFCG